MACAAVPSWQKAKRIVFLGDSITFAGHYVSWVEAWMSMKHPDPERVVINLGLPSETVSGLS
ncbi:MAG: G-D-S-L family lipolytic protein, partial [Akkermansiaceae bacterium]|nr:G-D-S-L family lipolytic protein [Akkermansiaceae bacterium]